MQLLKVCIISFFAGLRESPVARFLAGVLLFQPVFKALDVYAYTPLIASSDFAGILTDVGTTASGIISILIVILGIGILVRVLSR